MPKSFFLPYYQFLEKQFEMAPVIYEDHYRANVQDDWQAIEENQDLMQLLNYYDIIHADVITERHLLRPDFFLN